MFNEFIINLIIILHIMIGIDNILMEGASNQQVITETKVTEKHISRSKSNPPRRSSSRAKKLSAAMRVVDEETRRMI